MHSALEKDPKNEKIRTHLGKLYARKKNYPKAEEVLKAGVKESPKSEILLLALAEIYERQKKYELFEQYVRAVIEINPDSANALNYLGYSFAERGINLDEAEKLIIRALDLKKGDGYITDSLGWVYFQKGKYKKATELLEKANQLVPGEAVILEHLGDVWLKRGNKSKAREYFRESLKNTNEEKDRKRVEEKLQSSIAHFLFSFPSSFFKGLVKKEFLIAKLLTLQCTVCRKYEKHFYPLKSFRGEGLCKIKPASGKAIALQVSAIAGGNQHLFLEAQAAFGLAAFIISRSDEREISYDPEQKKAYLFSEFGLERLIGVSLQLRDLARIMLRQFDWLQSQPHNIKLKGKNFQYSFKHEEEEIDVLVSRKNCRVQSVVNAFGLQTKIEFGEHSHAIDPVFGGRLNIYQGEHSFEWRSQRVEENPQIPIEMFRLDLPEDVTIEKL